LPWLLAARRKKLRHLQLLLLLKLRPLLLRLLTQSRLTPLLLLTLPSRLTPLLRLLTLSLLTLPLRPLMQSRLKPLRPSNLRIIVKKPVARPVFSSLCFVPLRVRRLSFISAALSSPPRIQTALLDLAQMHQIAHKAFAAPIHIVLTMPDGLQGPSYRGHKIDACTPRCGDPKNESST
jgi:hypothetical protein